MQKLLGFYYRIKHAEEGQSLVEYGLIIALVALVVIGTLIALGGKLNGLFQSISGNL